MSSVKLYIAASLDGYIADREGGIDWLSEVAPFETDEDYGYAEFYDAIGALVMGRKTYEQVLGFGGWPYDGKPTYVFSTDPPAGEHPQVEFVSESPRDFVSTLFRERDDDLWLVGGAGLIASFRAEDLIDEYIISLMPVLLGEGVPLFEGAQQKESLRLVEAQSYESGVVQMHYVVHVAPSEYNAQTRR